MARHQKLDTSKPTKMDVFACVFTALRQGAWPNIRRSLDLKISHEGHSLLAEGRELRHTAYLNCCVMITFAFTQPCWEEFRAMGHKTPNLMPKIKTYISMGLGSEWNLKVQFLREPIWRQEIIPFHIKVIGWLSSIRIWQAEWHVKWGVTRRCDES